MLCPHCGSYAGDNEILCPGCGALLNRGEAGEEAGVRGIRQGRAGKSAPPPARDHGKTGASRIYVDPSAQGATRDMPVFADPQVYDADGEPLDTMSGYSRPARTVYGETGVEPTINVRPAPRRKVHNVTRHMINWAHVLIVVIVLLIGCMVGAYLYLSNTQSGQRILARFGQEANATAMWEVGEEYLDTGDVEQAILMFEQARELDGKDQVDVDNLLLLGSAYEADGRLEDAETLYTDIYTNITPSAPEAYRAMIRILLATGREPEAGELMQTAYEMTGQVTFRNQRTELLPVAPSVDLIAGYYEEKKTITLTSAQGYDIYYTFDAEAELPQDGVRYTEPLVLDEGTWDLRAVCVSGDLVSDPLNASYKVYMPSPQSPRSSLAPNTYKQRQRIWLKPGLENEKTSKTPEGDKETDITIYYTIDGSTPDIDSPVYDGEPFYLPGGYVTLRAVAVNGYGKASNTLEILYKIEAKPWPLSAYSVTDDVVNGLKLNETTREQFQQAYGTGTGMEEVTLSGIEGTCQKYLYHWGYATMAKGKSGWVLVELYFTDTTFKAPRSTAIGDTESYVVSRFRDMGQVESPSGNRGLYETDSGKGKIYLQEDGTKIIRYQAKTADSHTWQLDYNLNTAGTVTSIDMLYIP
ncbi:MAG: chitobiase/beta-hexosaminidase C-terminal domain-containing protein [Aristaeellaceae bacterium]